LRLAVDARDGFFVSCANNPSRRADGGANGGKFASTGCLPGYARP
jgi:hypothetical protein